MKKKLLVIVVAVAVMLGCVFGCVTTQGPAVSIERISIFGTMTGYSSLSLHSRIETMIENGQTELKVFIMSPGGIACDFTGAVDLIKYAQSKGIHVTTEAYGCVMSAAVPVFVAGDTRIAGPNTQFMVHRIVTEGYQLTEDDIECVTMLEGFYIKHVAAHSNLTEAEVGKMMDDVTFFTAKQALRWGMVDQIV